MHGTVTAVACELEGVSFSLRPNFFSAEGMHEHLEIRVQRDSGYADISDGLGVTVADVADVQARLGEALPIEGLEVDAPVRMTLVLGESCEVKKGRGIPVYMSAISGSIVFEAIHSPEHPSEDKRIAGRFEDVRFEDPSRPDEIFGVLSGSFDFFYTRGQPAQLFP